jgi:hypothetical protein
MSPRSLRRAAERKAVSQSQLAANRANAQLSHGATSPEGKAVSSRNHTIHGLTAVPTASFTVLPDEDQAAYDQSLADYRKEWKPATATEHDLVNSLALHAWLRDRAIRLQDNILREVGEITAVEDRRDFALFMRYYNTHLRAYGKAFSEIMRLRNFQMRQETQTLAIQIRFESQQHKAELHAAKMELIHLRQEALKQRNLKAAKTACAPPSRPDAFSSTS